MWQQLRKYDGVLQEFHLQADGGGGVGELGLLRFYAAHEWRLVSALAGISLPVAHSLIQRPQCGVHLAQLYYLSQGCRSPSAGSPKQSQTYQSQCTYLLSIFAWHQPMCHCHIMSLLRLADLGQLPLPVPGLQWQVGLFKVPGVHVFERTHPHHLPHPMSLSPGNQLRQHCVQ